MCDLLDIRYHEKRGNTIFTYEIDHYGCPAYLVVKNHIMEPRNIEQWLVQLYYDMAGTAAYNCRCSAIFTSWQQVLDHCQMYLCRDCETPTPQWEGWDYRCPACDVKANPDYHDRNPGYYGH